MTYDYYEEKRKQEEARIYRDNNGFTIRSNYATSAYASGEMDADSLRRFKKNNPELVEIINAQEREKERSNSTTKLLNAEDYSKSLYDKLRLLKTD